MSLYLTLAQVPELAGLTRRQRKLVHECALVALFAEQPSIVWVGQRWIFGGLLGGSLAGLAVVVGTGLSHPKLGVAAFALAGLTIGFLIGSQGFIARLRPYFRRVLEERKDELEKIRETEG
jgi:hypothetical protein